MKQSRRSYRKLLRGTLLVMAVAATTGWAGPGGRPASKPGKVASLLPEVRLRKVHLVRPDLILFPLCYEVCC